MITEQFPGEWPEVERVLYDTFKEFERLPGLNFAMEIPRAETLADDHKREIANVMTRYLREYGSSCRLDIVAQLARARVRVWYLEKVTGESGG